MPAVFCELQEIVQLALWRIRMYKNPHFSKGVAIVGQKALSINLEVRRPLYTPDGRPSKYDGQPVIAEKKLVLNAGGEFNLVNLDPSYQLSKYVNDIWGEQKANGIRSFEPIPQQAVKTGWMEI
jgi:hypothetical protein